MDSPSEWLRVPRRSPKSTEHDMLSRIPTFLVLCKAFLAQNTRPMLYADQQGLSKPINKRCRRWQSSMLLS
jgi:hypothetical protein